MNKRPQGRPRLEKPIPVKGITIRLSIELSDAIEEEAKKNRRPKTQEIIYTLEQKYLAGKK